MSKIIILTVDGGGIKGIIPSYFLSQLEAQLQKSCYEMFDIIGGTSTGGIIATALSSPINKSQPLTASEIYDIYTSDGAQIFVPQETILPDYYAHYYANDGSGNGVEPFLQQKFGDFTLNDARENMKNLKNNRTKHVFTTCYTVNSSGNTINNPTLGKDYGPYLFNWYDSDNAKHNYQVWEAARATSAAPTYFPVAKLGGGQYPNSAADERWALDGGVMSNNPAVWAVSEAFRTKLASQLSDIILISLGTGSYPSGAGLITDQTRISDPDYGNWGFTPWLVSDLDDLSGTENGRGAIVNIITESVQLVSSQQLSGLKNSGLNYFRLEPSITRAQSQMDNIAQSNVDSLIETATDYLQNDGKDIFADIVNILKQNI